MINRQILTFWEEDVKSVVFERTSFTGDICLHFDNHNFTRFYMFPVIPQKDCGRLCGKFWQNYNCIYVRLVVPGIQVTINAVSLVMLGLFRCFRTLLRGYCLKSDSRKFACVKLFMQK